MKRKKNSTASKKREKDKKGHNLQIDQRMCG